MQICIYYKTVEKFTIQGKGGRPYQGLVNYIYKMVVKEGYLAAKNRILIYCQ